MSSVVASPETGVLDPIIEVNCSNKLLDAFPLVIPIRTKILILDKNNIDNLEPLVKNGYYKGVLDVYLNYNNVKSIDRLEGSYFSTHFRVLSLIGNHITTVSFKSK